MNLSITKEQILNGLQAVQNVVSSRTTLPILSNVLLRAEGERLEFTATDLDVTVACSVEAKVKKGGVTTVPVRKLFGIVRELSGGELDMEVDDKNVCSVRSGNSFYKIHGIGADEFPPMPKFKDDKKVTLTQETAKSMLGKTAFAISTDESRYVLNGVFIAGSARVVWTLLAPLARRSLMTAAVLSFLHTVGEFGVVLMLGGDIPGATRTLSIVLYDQVENFDYSAAGRTAALLLSLSLVALVAMYAVGQARRRPSA